MKNEKLSKYINELKLRGLSEKTLTAYYFANERFLKFISKEPKYVTTQDIKHYINFMLDQRMKPKTINLAIDNLVELVKRVPIIVLEHHLLRTEKWKDAIRPVLIAAEEFGHQVLTAAEFSGKDNNILEFKRKELYEEKPPSKEFLKWTRLSRYKKKINKPPL